jgi:hypothetical protein
MKRVIVDIGVFFFLWSTVSNAEMRIWTSVKGDTVEAEYIKMFAGKVVLKKTNGKQIQVPKSGLCAEDIKYLSESIPPKIEIDVDADRDRKEVGSYSSDYSSYGWAKKTEKVKCEVTITKKSREENTTPLTARLYVFSKNFETEELKVISLVEQEFSFKHQKNTVLSSAPVLLEFQKSSTFGDRGESYGGYLAYVEDERGQIIEMEGSRDKFEENLGKIKSGVLGTRFDDDFDMLNPPKQKKNKRGRNRD